VRTNFGGLVLSGCIATKYYTTRLAPPLKATFAPAEDMARFSDISSDRFLMTDLAKEAGDNSTRGQ